MENTTVTIRRATAADIPAIHGLVRELAVYEQAEGEFIATREEYERDFAAGIFQALVAELPAADGPRVTGMALYYMTYSTWKGRMLYLEDFVVSGRHRGGGIGRMLFDAFLEEARRQGCRLVKWQVLDWNEPALRFYQKYEATIERDWWNGKIFF